MYKYELIDAEISRQFFFFLFYHHRIPKLYEFILNISFIHIDLSNIFPL